MEKTYFIILPSGMVWEVQEDAYLDGLVGDDIDLEYLNMLRDLLSDFKGE